MNSQQLRDRLKSLEDAFYKALTAEEIKIGWLKTRVKTIAEIAKRAAIYEIESGERLDAAAVRQMADAFIEQLFAVATRYLPDEAIRHEVISAFCTMPPVKMNEADCLADEGVLIRVRDTIAELAANEPDDDREVLLSQLAEQLSKSVDAIARTVADTVPVAEVDVWKSAMGSKFQDAAEKYLSDDQQLVLDCELANL